MPAVINKYTTYLSTSLIPYLFNTISSLCIYPTGIVVGFTEIPLTPMYKELAIRNLMMKYSAIQMNDYFMARVVLKYTLLHIS